MPSYSLELCYITNRQVLNAGSLLPRVFEAIAAGVDMIQIREKDAGTKFLMDLAAAAVSRARGGRTRIVLNDRLDIAVALGAAGVHLGAHSLPAPVVREIMPRNFLLGVSCHSLEDALSAESAGADYLLLGPIFETPSKSGYGPPLGLSKLHEVARKVKIPLLALGGITPERVSACQGAGAAGVAGIRIFQEAPSLSDRVAELRTLWAKPTATG